MKNFTRILIATLVMIVSFAYSQQVFKVANVGIGKINPAQKLDVVGNVQFTGALMPGSVAGTTGDILLSAGGGVAPTWLANGSIGNVLTIGGGGVPTWAALSTSATAWQLTGNGSTTAGTNFIGTTDANDLVFKTNATEYMRIKSTTSSNVHIGSVGIGTASPISLLHIASSSLSGTGEVGLTIQDQASGGGNYRVWVSDNGNGEGSNKFIIYDNTANADRVTLNGSGNLGIGTTGPLNKLDVSGAEAIGSYAGSITAPSNGLIVSGNVGIGTNNPGTQLEVDQVDNGGGTGMIYLNSTGTEAGIGFRKTTNGTQQYSIKDGDNTSGASYFAIHDETASGGPARMVIASSTGYVGLGTTSPSQELDVEGNGGSIRFAGELMPGGNAGTSGQILQSNGSGSTPTWVNASSGGSGWALTGNSGTTYGTNFIGTSDNVGLMFKVDGQVSGRIESASASGSSWQNTSFGYQALNPTTGSNYDWYNTAIGYQALTANQYGSWNTAIGDGALANNTGTSGVAGIVGSQNTALGAYALNGNINGGGNVALGNNALVHAQNANYNEMVGWGAASNATITGSYNDGLGAQALNNLTGGQYNDAMGYQSQYNLSSGTSNVAIGYHTLYNNTTAASNVAVGYSSQINTTASKNVAVGDSTLYTNTTGSSNTAVGYRANVGSNNLTNATAIGANATVSASNLVQLGNSASVQFDKALMPGGNAGTSGYVLQSNGVGNAPTWVAPSGGSSTVITDSSETLAVENTITGNGSAISPLKLAQQHATSAQVLQWNGTSWVPATITGGVGDNWGTQTAVTNSTLTGNGLSSTPLGIAQQGAITGQALEWNGTAWAPATVSGSGWALTGNSATTPGTNFIGTTDAKDLVFKTHNNEIMRIANSTNNVGIGTSTPNSASALEIDQNYNGGGIGMIHLNSSGGEAGISMLNGNGQQYSFKDGDAGSGATYFAIHDESDGSTPLVITPGSYNDVNASFMGINQTNPQTVLDLYYSGGDASGNAGITIENGSSGNGSYRWWVSDGSNGEGDGKFMIYDNNQGQDRFTLDQSGNIGLGTTSPAQGLDVENGNLQFGAALMPGGNAGTSGQVLQSNGVNTAPTWVNPSSGGGGSGWALTGNSGTTAGTNFIGTTDGKDLVFKTNSTEYMRIVSTTAGSVHAGSVGIGTTSPLTLLTITSSSLSGTGEVGLTIQNTASGGGTFRLWSSDNGNGEGAGKFFIWDNTASQNRVAINSSGDVGLGTNSPVQELDVEGNGGSIRFAGELMPGGNAGTSGQILQSNGSGSTPTWVNASSGGSGWALTGNSSTTYGTNFIGTSDNVGLMFKVDGQVSGRIESASATGSSWQNTSFGYQALNNTTGSNYDWYNTAIGYQALKSNQYGSFNVAVGVGALTNNTGTSNSASSGAQNVAVGSSALNANTTGSYNVGVGQNAIINGNGSYNTMVGCDVASNATVTGSFNEGIGYQTFQNLTGGQYNDAMGYQSQYNLSSGTSNVAIGYHTLYSNTTAASNVAVGYSSQINTTASKNVSVGDSALYTNTTGSSNTALGYRANVGLNNLTNATAIGSNAVATVSNQLVLGSNGTLGTAITMVGFTGALAPYYSGAYQTGTAGQVLTSNGAGTPTWQSASSNVVTDSSLHYPTENTLTGNGSSASPLKIAQDGATNAQVLQWNGTTWKPATISGGVGDNWGTQVVVTNSTLTGNGTSGSVLGIAQQGAATGQALEWNGTVWAPATVSGTGWALTGNSATTPGTNFIGTTDAKDLVFKTHNNEIMRIANSTNNVGIGTSTPNSASELEIDQNFNGGGTGMLHLHSTGTEAGISLLEDNNSNGSQQYSIKDGDNGAGQTYLAIHDESNGTTPFVITPANNTPDNSNFVGINQTSPGSVLDVFYPGGNGDGNAGVTIENGDYGSYRLWISDGSNQEDNGNGGFLIWDNNNSTDRFLLTPNGQFGLNLGQNGTPQSELDVNGNVTIGGDYAGNNGAPNNGMLVEGATSIGTTSNANELDVAGNMAIGSYAGANGAPSGGLIVSGNMGIATNSPNSTLQVGSGSANSGNVSMPINVLSSSGTINLSTSPSNYTVILTATPSVTLPAASASNKGRIYILVNGTANAGTISSYIPHGTSTSSTTFPASITLQIQSSGSSWYQIN